MTASRSHVLFALWAVVILATTMQASGSRALLQCEHLQTQLVDTSTFKTVGKHCSTVCCERSCDPHEEGTKFYSHLYILLSNVGMLSSE
jgi:hypothetical protein